MAGGWAAASTQAFHVLLGRGGLPPPHSLGPRTVPWAGGSSLGFPSALHTNSSLSCTGSLLVYPGRLQVLSFQVFPPVVSGDGVDLLSPLGPQLLLRSGLSSDAQVGKNPPRSLGVRHWGSFVSYKCQVSC